MVLHTQSIWVSDFCLSWSYLWPFAAEKKNLKYLLLLLGIYDCLTWIVFASVMEKWSCSLSTFSNNVDLTLKFITLKSAMYLTLTSIEGASNILVKYEIKTNIFHFWTKPTMFNFYISGYIFVLRQTKVEKILY